MIRAHYEGTSSSFLAPITDRSCLSCAPFERSKAQREESHGRNDKISQATKGVDTRVISSHSQLDFQET